MKLDEKLPAHVGCCSFFELFWPECTRLWRWLPEIWRDPHYLLFSCLWRFFRLWNILFLSFIFIFAYWRRFWYETRLLWVFDWFWNKNCWPPCASEPARIVGGKMSLSDEATSAKLFLGWASLLRLVLLLRCSCWFLSLVHLARISVGCKTQLK